MIKCRFCGEEVIGEDDDYTFHSECANQVLSEHYGLKE